MANHKQLTEFAEYRGLEELSSALLSVNDILRDLWLREPRKQTLIDSFFNNLTYKFNYYIKFNVLLYFEVLNKYVDLL